MMNFEFFATDKKITRVLFCKAGWFHDTYLGDVSLILHPEFMIPNAGDCVTLWNPAENDYHVYRVIHRWIHYKEGQIEIRVK